MVSMDPSAIPASISSRPGMRHVDRAAGTRPARLYAGAGEEPLRMPRVQTPETPLVIPLVGVTTYVADTAWASWERRAAVLPESYFELVAAAGGRPLLLPPPSSAPGGPGAGADEVVAVLDALVLTGGGDVDPQAYGEQPDPEVSGVDTNRDASERALLAAALRADMPVLAICRGCQVLNVELGGTLHQHLPDVIGTLAHRSAPFVFGDVGVQTVPGSLAAGVFGDQPTVRCSHHQAIRELGHGLVPTAR